MFFKSPLKNSLANSLFYIKRLFGLFVPNKFYGPYHTDTSYIADKRHFSELFHLRMK